MIKEVKNMVVVGSGNVAWHMINAFQDKGITVLQILARNAASGRELSEAFDIPLITNVNHLRPDADMYLLTVQDSQLHSAAKNLAVGDNLLVHTSGFTPLEELAGYSRNTGVCWPLQTLTKGKAVDYRQIPYFIEGNNEENTARLERFAHRVSNRIIRSDSGSRRMAHLAAVIASNLSNRLYAIAADILTKNNIPFDVLVPLILETAHKAGEQAPHLSQTGPASRNDLHVIETHLKMLQNDPAYREIYRIISENIIQLQNRRHEEL